MGLLKSKHWLLFIYGVVLLILAAPLRAEQAGTRADLLLSPGGHPAADSIFVPPFEEGQEPAIDNAWYLRTGAAKGLSVAMDSDEERFAAADTAVLARGFSPAWKKILTGQQEPFVLVGPDDIAGLNATKKLLIVPTGALSGTAESVFFRSSIDKFTNAGGIVFCLAQRFGRDYSALPAPQAHPIQAVGWSEDSGPLFRSSTIRMNHPLLTGLSGNSPILETEGYISSAPPGSRILLARADGNPTLLVFPSGKGWVVVSALITDFSYLSGGLEADERTIIRNLLAWSRNAGQAQPDSPSSTPLATDKAATVSSSTAPAGYKSEPQLQVRTAVEGKNNMVRISFELPPSPGFYNEILLVRAGGQEKTFTLSPKESTALALDIPRGSEKRLAYKFYRQNGRSITRGSVAVPESDNIGPDHTISLPGQSAAIRLAGLGRGELGLRGIGYFDTQVTSGTDTIHVPLPSGLPQGTYRMEWQLDQMQGRKQGEFGIDVAGAGVDVEEITIGKKKENQRIVAAASVRLRANQNVSGTLRLTLRGPRGEHVVLAEPVLSLVKGAQTVPVPFRFSPLTAGIWELTSSFMVTIPEGVGLPEGPVTLASGSTLFDIGDAAILSATTDKPIYYEPSGTVTVTAAIFGAGKKSVRVILDDREISREKVELAGITRYSRALPSLEPGMHSIRVEAESDMGVSSRDLKLIYGFLLPDLTASIKSEKPRAGAQGPEMPVTVQVVNRGKSQAAASHVIVYDGDPSKGTVIKKLEVPPLRPGEQHLSLIEWALYKKAGKHTLWAVADANGEVKEPREQNNTASVETEIPELLLTSSPPEKTLFAADEAISMRFSVFNLGTHSLDGIKLVTSVQDPAGRHLGQETIAVDKLAPGTEKKIASALSLALPGIGAYALAAAVWKEKEISSTVAGFSVGPTLSLQGSLEGTPAAAVLCRPFTIDYSIRNSGNILPSSGTVWLEIVRPGAEKPLFSRQLPFIFGEKTVRIENLDLPAGAFLLRLRAKAGSEQHKVTRAFTLLEQALTITGPIEIARLGSSFPRILVWLGREGRRVERAVSESIVKQAFEREDVYYKVVDSEEAFSTHAMTGMFNNYVLFEPEEPLKTDWLKKRVERGEGLIIIGSGETAQAILQEFGFVLEDGPAKQTTALTFSADSGLDLSGTMPVSGRMLSPRKRGAISAAVYSPEEKPAVLIEKAGKGTLIAMPLSVSRSASSGATAQYSLALRKMAFFITPEKDESHDPEWGGLMVSSKGGPVRARIKEIFPEGSEVIWSNLQGKQVKNTLTFELELDRDPRKLLYLYRSPASRSTLPQLEASYECAGAFADQEKVE